MVKVYMVGVVIMKRVVEKVGMVVLMVGEEVV